MIDMLVRLYDLPDSREIYEEVEGKQGVILRRPGVYELHLVTDWVRAHFSRKWASEVEMAFSHQPMACYIATQDRKIVGFSCFDTTAKGFYGPAGVLEGARGSGIGKALLFKSLEALKHIGYAYAIVGNVGAGPREFYRKACGAVEIEGSNPGIYADILPEPDQ